MLYECNLNSLSYENQNAVKQITFCIPYKFDVHFQQLLAALVQTEESRQDFLVLQFSSHLILTQQLDQSPGRPLCIPIKHNDSALASWT